MGYPEYHCDRCEFSYIGNYVFYSEILDNAYAGSNTVTAKGIDISKWNHRVNPDGSYAPIDWNALKNAGFDYVILKIGSSIRTKADGTVTGGIEPTFEMDYEGAKAAGLDVGVYFFTYSTNVSGIKKDAELLIEWLDGKQFEYPIYLDLEDDTNANYYPSEIAAPILTEMCLTFFSELQRDGYYTGLYVNNNFLFNILQTDNMIELFEIWYARYPSNSDYIWNAEDDTAFTWNTEKYGETLGMWQYTCTGIFDSISGKLDFNYAYKDYPTLIKYYGFNGYSAES
jgi:GH25 family lysozyme M1 (1,4-beta-N-acetylmuramidase)